MGDSIRFENHRFGQVEVEESRLLHFPGIPGFPDARRFVVMEHDRDSVFAWLVCVDDPDLAFAIADPWHFFPDYRPPVERQHLEALRVEAPDDLQILAIASFSEQKPRFNLAAPLLMNLKTRQGMQVIFDQDDYSTREEIQEGQAPA